MLPRILALLAVTLGTLGPVLGLAGLFTVTANNNGAVGAPINALVAAQGLWMIGASTTLPLAHRAMTLKPATGWRFPGARRP